MDFFTRADGTMNILYGFFVIHHDRRRILHFNATYHPTAQWVIQQLREASRSTLRPDISSSIGTRFSARRWWNS